MKRILVTAVLGLVLAANTGCCCFDRLFCCNRGGNGCGGGCNSAPSCDSCGGGGGCGCGHGGGMGGGDMGGPMYGHHGAQGAQGPTGAAVAYPYYTTRGPRDFFANNPGAPRN